MIPYRKFVRTLSIITSIFLFASCISAPDYAFFSNIYGYVTDSSDGEPISGATVMLIPGNRTQQTGTDGSFRFENLDVKQYTLSVQKANYQTNRKTVTAVIGEDIQVSIQLSRSVQ